MYQKLGIPCASDSGCEPLLPQLSLKPLSPDDGRDIYELLQQIDADDHGFGNKAYGMDYPQYREWLQNEYAVDSGKLEAWMVPQSSYWLYYGDTPVGYGRIRHSLNDALRASGGHIGYAIGKPYRSKGYGHAILALLMTESRRLGLTELQIGANCDNLRSNRVIAAAGGRLLREVDGKNIYLVALG